MITEYEQQMREWMIEISYALKTIQNVFIRKQAFDEFYANNNAYPSKDELNVEIRKIENQCLVEQ